MITESQRQLSPFVGPWTLERFSRSVCAAPPLRRRPHLANKLHVSLVEYSSN
jgi:hypothetical protein